MEVMCTCKARTARSSFDFLPTSRARLQQSRREGSFFLKKDEDFGGSVQLVLHNLLEINIIKMNRDLILLLAAMNAVSSAFERILESTVITDRRPPVSGK
jgi:hypothetical protein